MPHIKQPAAITIGIKEDGGAVTWPGAYGSPHMAVLGSTGSGAPTLSGGESTCI